MNRFHGDSYTASSAGTEPTGVNPLAQVVMAEIGVDMTNHWSKSVQKFLERTIVFDLVVTVCDHARETCPIFPGGKDKIHHSFEDPSQIIGDTDLRMEVFRRSRDEIRQWIDETF